MNERLRDRWSTRFAGSLAAIVIGVPVVTFGSVAYWSELTTSDVALAADCEPERYGIVDSGTRYVVEKFTTVGSCDWTVPAGVTEVEVLVVGGGGQANEHGGGGGGAGGVLEQTVTNLSSAMTVVVGSGGAGGGLIGGSGLRGTNGSNSSFGSVVASGGGGGGSYFASPGGPPGDGGSGGGAANSNVADHRVGGVGTVGQGFDGGDVTSSGTFGRHAAGGGGATEAGGSETVTAGVSSGAGDGGDGLTSAITGVSTTYGGGGGGGGYAGGTGGQGGGGDGDTYCATVQDGCSVVANVQATAGQNGLGGGGGGGTGIGGATARAGKAGGSGIVVVRYEAPDSDRDWAMSANWTAADGASSAEYFEAAGQVLDYTGTDGSVEAWVYFDPDEDTQYSVLGASKYMYIATWALQRNIGGQLLDYPIRVGDSWPTSVEMPQGRWAHIAATWSGTNASLYIDGQLADSTTTFTSPGTSPIGASPFRIGAIYDNPSTVGSPWSSFWDGMIDEVRVWNDVRTPSEIAAGMHTSVSATATDLAAYWDFNQSSGTTVSAIGSAGANATLTAVGSPTFTELGAADTASRSGWTIHEFERSYITTAGGWTVPSGVTAAEYLLVGGGGGGGAWVGGGGGGGGVLTGDASLTPGTTEAIQVGQGGRGSRMRGVNTSSSTNDWLEGSDGGASSFAGESVLGGGLGASWTLAASTAANQKSSGGGGVRFSGNGAAGAGTASNGGAPASETQPHLAGGGGGAGGNGNTGGTVANTSGSGGAGVASTITGSSVRYGGGGGGSAHGTYTSPPTCNNCSSVYSGSGVDGGGDGATPVASSAIRIGGSGTPNLGGGGGGSSNHWSSTYPYQSLGGSGGSGVVVVAYPMCVASSVQTVTIGGIEYQYQTFTTPDDDASDGTHNGDLQCAGSWTVPADVTSVDVLVVAGGGGGGANPAMGVTAGGGGAGGLILDTIATTPGESVSVSVGSGGDGALWGTDNAGDQGMNSVFGSLIAIGGGGGGSYQQAGTTGGSGGGNGNGNTTVGTGTSGQGSDGVYYNQAGTGGEGGGASGSGKHGITSTITGTAVTYGRGASVIPPVSSNAGSGDGGSGGYDYNASTIDNGLAGSSGTVIVRWVADPADALPVIDLYARYRAGDYDATTKIWTDSSGNGRHTLAADVRGTPATSSAVSTGGSSVTFPIVTGTTSDGLAFPVGVLPTDYTLFHVARYSTGGTEGRIFKSLSASTADNWLSGFWNGLAGVAYHGAPTTGWITANTTDHHGNDWVVSSDQMPLYRSQGVNRTTNGANGTLAAPRLVINTVDQFIEHSDWQVGDVLVFGSQLTSTQLRAMENYLGRSYGTTLPGLQPSGVTAATVSGQTDRLTVSWTAPSDSGLTPTGYSIEQSSDGGTTWTTATTSGTVAAAGTTVTGLTGGTDYVFRVTADLADITNEFPSPASTAVAPLIASTTALTWSPASPDDTDTITLTATVTDGTDPISGVSVAFDDGSATITGCGAVTTNASGIATCSWGPTTASTYSVTATTTDAAIVSSFDTRSITVADSAPGQPTGLTATPNGAGQVDLTWTAPASGATPTDYTIGYRLSGSDSWFAWNPTTSTSTSESITGLGSGRDYEFRVTALAAALTGTPSVTATATTAISAVLSEFTSTGTTSWKVPNGVNTVDVLVVGGGGGGGGTGSRSGFSGGGGAGGDVKEEIGYSVTPGEDIALNVGAGGNGGSPSSNDGRPTEGGNSSFGSLTAVGGGRGGHSIISSYTDANVPSGGSRHGGGGGAQALRQTGAQGTGDFHSGGNGYGSSGTDQAAGGGAGAGGNGAHGASDDAGDGGPGVASAITGNTYGGGGGGGKRYSGGSLGLGGSGGGGAGGRQSSGVAGTDGTGGGGGGGGSQGSPAASASGGNGGSGIVVIRHAPVATSTPDLIAASDTGSSNSDNRTGDNTPTFTGTAQYGSTVQLYVDDGTGPVATGSTCTPSTTTYIWSCTADTLADDVYEISAIATFTDVNGVTLNEVSSSLEVTIDTSVEVDAISLADATALSAYSVTLTASGGVSPLTWSVTSGSLPTGITLSSGGVLSGTPTATGTSSFTVTVTDSNNTPVSDSLALTLTVVLASQTITFADPADRDWSATAFTLSPSTDASGLTVTLTSSTTNVCTVSGFTITMVRSGTCTLTASQAGNSTYAAATDVTHSLEITAATQTITFAPNFPTTTYGDDPFSIAGTASSDLVLDYSTSTPTICSVSGDLSLSNGATNAVVTPIGAGSCTITAAQAGDGRYGAATSVSRSFTIAKAAQVALVFTSGSSGVWGDVFTAAVSGGSGAGAVSFGAVAGTAGCAVNATTGAVTYSSAGTCTITADKAGDANRLAAGQVSQTLTIAKAAQTVTFTSTVPAEPLPGDTYTVTGTATSGLTPAFSVTAGQVSVCSLSGGVVTFLATGTCTISVGQSGDGRFSAATAQTQTIAVGSLNQSILVTTPADVSYGAPGFAVDAAASSSLTVTATSSDTDVCTMVGLVVTPVDVGDCELTFTQTGNSRYAAASPVTISFRVVPARPTAPSIVSVSAGNANATIGFTAPGFTGGAALSAYTIIATPTSGTAVTDTTCTASPCTITGLTNGTAYTLTITANNTAGAGPASTASPAVTPATRATAVTTLSATPGNGTLRVTWGAPADFGGGTFTRYELRIAADGDAMPADASATVNSSTTGSYTFTGLNNGTGYNVEIVTITSANQTAITGNTASLSSVPVSVPGVPEALTISAFSPRVVRVTWSEPLRDGGAVVTGYTVTITDSDGTDVECGTVTIEDGVRSADCTSDLLELSTTYTITVAAVNRIGAGALASATHTTPTFTAPTTPPVTTGETDPTACPCVFDPDGNPVPVDVERTPTGSTPGQVSIDVAPSTISLGGTGSGTSGGSGQATTWVDATGRFTAQTPGSIPFGGGGALAGTTVTIFVDGVAIGTAIVNPDGTWTFDLTLPDGTNGPVTITIVWIDRDGTQQTLTTPITIIASGDAATAPRTPTTGTQLAVDPDTAIALGPNGETLDAQRTTNPATNTITVTVGDTTINITPTDNGQLDTTGRLTVTHPARVRVTGDNMLPNTTATVWIMSNPQRLGTVTVATDGTIDTTYSIPTGIDPGNHTIQIDTTDTNGQALTIALGLTITTGLLPTTGANTDTHLAWLTLMLAIGALTTLTTHGNRRRRSA